MIVMLLARGSSKHVPTNSNILWMIKTDDSIGTSVTHFSGKDWIKRFNEGRDRANIVTSIKSIKCLDVQYHVRTKTDRVAYHSIIVVSHTNER
ncbi:uncharacterized protein LOC122514185 [Polistes fuscatus]|uniref:uncharacterized protein LOC122514185 n=1 Tax=Polistes fuscatus TaxID=30207 RepID=UPI001CA950DB|nr:uncharacterized protein LOC122514185 [Polistes fuscatus]